MKSLFSNYLFVLILFICLSVQYGSSLSCYECNDRIATTPCKNVTSKYIKKCGFKDPVCTTEWYRDRSFGKNATYIRRACADVTMIGAHKVFFKNNQSTIMYCNDSLCNAAFRVPSTKAMLFISAVLSLYFFKNVY